MLANWVIEKLFRPTDVAKSDSLLFHPRGGCFLFSGVGNLWVYFQKYPQKNRLLYGHRGNLNEKTRAISRMTAVSHQFNQHAYESQLTDIAPVPRFRASVAKHFRLNSIKSFLFEARRFVNSIAYNLWNYLRICLRQVTGGRFERILFHWYVSDCYAGAVGLSWTDDNDGKRVIDSRTAKPH